MLDIQTSVLTVALIYHHREAEVEQINNFRFLRFTESLSWSSHTPKHAKKAQRQLYVFRELKGY